MNFVGFKERFKNRQDTIKRDGTFIIKESSAIQKNLHESKFHDLKRVESMDIRYLISGIDKSKYLEVGVNKGNYRFADLISTRSDNFSSFSKKLLNRDEVKYQAFKQPSQVTTNLQKIKEPIQAAVNLEKSQIKLPKIKTLTQKPKLAPKLSSYY